MGRDLADSGRYGQGIVPSEGSKDGVEPLPVIVAVSKGTDAFKLFRFPGEGV
jgi:hypothetical protein